jgi:hypothetical protein
MRIGCTIGLIQLFARFPKLGGVFGLLAAGAFGFAGILNWNELQTMPQRPEALSLSDAIHRVNTEEDIWVEIEWVEWDCSNIVYSGAGSDADAEVIFTNEAHSVLGVAKFSNRQTCEDLAEGTAVGVLRRMSESFYERLPQRGFDLAGYVNVDSRVHLCTYCGRGNSMLGVICSATFVPLGLMMYPLCLSLRKHYQRKGLL